MHMKRAYRTEEEVEKIHTLARECIAREKKNNE